MLYLVSTPIGNLADISYRAIEVLNSVDVILCEDTRHSLKLLDHYGIKKQLISYHKFNEVKETEPVINLLKEGKNVALITDAGTPVVSDPGNVLTKALSENGIEFTVVPGATACISALLLSGLDASNFTFIGFLPEKKKDKQALLKTYKNVPSTLIFYAAPPDVNKDLKELYEGLGDRRAVAVKEITKLHERVYRFNLSNAEIVDPRGEFVIVVEGAKKQENAFDNLTELEHINLYLSRGLSKKEAIKIVANERGVSKNSLYKYTINED
ncbi:MAG: 16S rRNA (cytidine(1402)-2'-O)-methyltransferase [Clostridia bacterium]|nr:16S rRNA (cytidine(1402)-2'-O)-methyltransferase [Clostridia bacterium]